MPGMGTDAASYPGGIRDGPSSTEADNVEIRGARPVSEPAYGRT